jgi:integrase/recombinase XerD
VRKHNADNELAKREYLAWLKNAATREEATLDAAAAAIDGFEAFNRYRSFKAFRREQAISYKAHIAEQTHPKTGKPLSKATIRARLMALRAFFEWLSREQGFKRTVTFSDAAYFNPSANDMRIATASREQPAPSLEQVVRVLEAMPADTVIERRDRAVVAFTILTGARDSAVASMLLRDVDVTAGRVFQDARHVKTKRAKTFYSAFFPVGDLPRHIVCDWVAELQTVLLFGPDEPFFPATRRGVDNQGFFATEGLERHPWTSAAPIRAIFKRAFEAAGFRYANPHSLRRTLVRLAYDLDLSQRELKAWSQNLGHESMMTTLVSYGSLNVEEQVAAINGIAVRSDDGADDVAVLVAKLTAAIAKPGYPKAA